MTKLLAFILVLIAAQSSQAGYIVKFENGFLDNKNNVALFSQSFQIRKDLVSDLGIFLVESKSDSANIHTSLQILRSMPFIKYVQFDHKLSLRKTPNDTQYKDQWHLAKISAPAAWDMSVGGKNLLGNQPVIAIVDEGVDVTHDDLKENIWVNAGEIPANQIDDDKNGYVDDIHGWSVSTNSGNIPAGEHATHVAGIAGARGDNNLMVTGINWDVKIMSVEALGGTNLTSDALAAYGYVLKQKQIWLQTNGDKGANVVATNSSFGVDRADCNSGEYPAWNDMYDQLGKVGILSAAATANGNWDIDQTGDIPTGCKSQYLVTVTNTTIDDLKNTEGAAWGLNTVQIGAPGTDILSSIPGNSTTKMTGTSMATPVISGAIAFLHSIASGELARMALSDPSKAALVVKGLLLTTVDPLADLKGRTVSGGRVNLQKAAAAALAYKSAKN